MDKSRIMSSQAIAKQQTSKNPSNIDVPEQLIYEVVGGEPIYYKGYQEVLNGNKHAEEIMAESTLQGWLKLHIGAILINFLENKGYIIAAGEIGLNISKDDKRGADITIFKKENWKLHEHFSDLPPEIIIEIDTKADLKEQTYMEYISRKIDDYHNFGVKKVIWIFTSPKKVTISEQNSDWITQDWDKNIDVIEGFSFNLETMLQA